MMFFIFFSFFSILLFFFPTGPLGPFLSTNQVVHWRYTPKNCCGGERLHIFPPHLPSVATVPQRARGVIVHAMGLMAPRP